MAINERVITGTTAEAGGAASLEQGLILHLDANDVDSYDGDGSVWYDISTHDVTVPLSDNDDSLKIHYNPSDSNSYSGSGTTLNNLAGDTLDASVVASRYDIDNGGFFDVSSTSYSEYTISVPDGHPLDGTGNSFTLEFWFNWKATPSGGERFIYEPNTGWNFFYYGGLGWRINNADCDTGYFSNNVAATAGEWNHFAMSQDSSNCKVYLNGTLVKTQAVTSGTRDVGSFSFGSTSLDGVNCKIGAIRMYNDALSVSDVGQNYRHGRDYIYTGLNSNSDLFLHYDPADTNSYSGTGTTLTDLVGNNNADLLGGIESGWDEELGNSFPMTGYGDGITTSSTVSINPANGMTIEMWVKVKTNVQNYLFSFDGTETTGFGLSYRSYLDTNYPNKILWWYRNSWGSASYVSSNIIVLNEWTHIVATTNGSSAQFYTNGVLSEQTSSSAYNISYNEDLHFGNMYDLAQNNNSDIGQIRFYKGGLTADEVMQNYNFTKNDYPNGYNGTISGATWNSSGYFEFDGSNDFIEIPTSTSFTSAYNFSIAIWINPISFGSDRMITSLFGSAQDFKFDIRFNQTNGNIRFMVAQPSGGYVSSQDLTTTNTISTSTYHHVVFVYDNDNDKMQIYIDGALDSTKTGASAGTNTSITEPIMIGKREDLGFYSNIKLTDYRFYDKALTQAEVTALYNEGE